MEKRVLLIEWLEAGWAGSVVWGGFVAWQALAIGAVLAAVVAGAGLATEALTGRGALAAWGVGALVFGLGGPAWALLVILFFLSSSLVSRWRDDIKAKPSAVFAKGSRRDAGQVLANGAVAALLAVAHLFFPEAAPLFAAFVGALAAVTADTWATEVGLLSDAPPVLITSGEPVERGTSGGVTVLGTVAATAGATLIGVAAAVLFAAREAIEFGIFDARMLDFGPDALRLLPIAAVAGLASAAFDSFLGATVQGVYYSDSLQRETERSRDAQGDPHPLVRGRRWITNDVVNVAASVCGAGVAWVLYVVW